MCVVSSFSGWYLGVYVLQRMRLLCCFCSCFFFQAEDGIRDLVRSRGLGDVYKRQVLTLCDKPGICKATMPAHAILSEGIVPPSGDSS